MKYSMFIGRWQPWHAGHRWLIDQRLNENKNVLICIRDMKTDTNNPYTPREVKINVEKELKDLVENKKVKINIIKLLIFTFLNITILFTIQSI